jgi:hypothetical protein
MRSYLIGAKLGDAIHQLVIPSYIYSQTGRKATIYLSEQGDKFSTSLLQTYRELLPVMQGQPFIEKFLLHEGQPYDVGLHTFNTSPLLFNRAWSEIYFRKFLPTTEIPRNFQWLKPLWPKTGSIIVNRSPRPWSKYTESRWLDLLTANPTAQFLCCDIKQYEQFPLKHLIAPLLVSSIGDMFKAIDEATLFIGNQSSPLAYASAIQLPRVAELRKNPDAPHYEWETLYSDTLSTFSGD